MNPPIDILADDRRVEKILFTSDCIGNEQMEKLIAEIFLIRGIKLPEDVEPNAHTRGIPCYAHR
jgi:hypothetical protein